jgi:hypothetical protein
MIHFMVNTVFLYFSFKDSHELTNIILEKNTDGEI